VLITDVPEFSARARPEDPALVFEDRTWSARQFAGDVSRLRAGLAALIAPGDRIAVVSENRPEMAMSLYSGIPTMFGNARLAPSELADLLADVEPTVLVGSADQLERLSGLHRRFESVHTAVCLDDRGGDVGISALMASGRGAAAAAGIGVPDPGDTAWIIHTSGTTGTPKGAVITHRSLLAAVANTAIARPAAPDDVYYFPFPLFHVAAYNVVHHHLRRRPVVLARKFDAAAALATIEAERVTSASMAPTMISMLLDHPARPDHDLSSLRQLAYGASAIPLSTLRRGMTELGCGFAQGYGMTELSGNAVFLDPDAHRLAASSAPHLLAAAGVPAPMVSIRIVDESFADCAIDEPGEILVHGDQVIPRYWNQPDTTAAAFVDGWFRTGDIGRIDDLGFLYVVDRLKDIIVTGGENVSSREVEDVISTHPDVAGVAVIGIPHDRWGEQIVAVVVPRNERVDPAALIRHCEEHLAGFKKPKLILSIDELPVNASGKVLKTELRQWASARAGIEELPGN